MIVLGVDPGTRHLGWGVVRRDGTRLVHLGHGVIHTRVGADLAQRLVQIARELGAVIDRHSPAVAAVETLFFHKDASAAAKLGHARGVVLLCAAERGITLAEYQPARVKRTIAGSGRAEKAQVAQMISALLKLGGTPPSDAADALALAITHLRAPPAARPLVAAKARASSRARAELARLVAERGRKNGVIPGG